MLVPVALFLVQRRQCWLGWLGLGWVRPMLSDGVVLGGVKTLLVGL
jgi:hypothetical protein